MKRYHMESVFTRVLRHRDTAVLVGHHQRRSEVIVQRGVVRVFFMTCATRLLSSFCISRCNRSSSLDRVCPGDFGQVGMAPPDMRQLSTARCRHGEASGNSDSRVQNYCPLPFLLRSMRSASRAPKSVTKNTSTNPPAYNAGLPH